MPEDDIYKSKQKYERFVKIVKSGEFLLPPEKRERRVAGIAKLVDGLRKQSDFDKKMNEYLKAVS